MQSPVEAHNRWGNRVNQTEPSFFPLSGSTHCISFFFKESFAGGICLRIWKRWLRSHKENRRCKLSQFRSPSLILFELGLYPILKKIPLIFKSLYKKSRMKTGGILFYGRRILAGTTWKRIEDLRACHPSFLRTLVIQDLFPHLVLFVNNRFSNYSIRTIANIQ